ncbi:HAD superfamily hydrolase [Spiroplasma litorale]|uniref:HAD superfamily hydrolase n=1 Tax=Spiroplasma litorale TaxID=216942 RepID=A0A0K1W0U7_9MOLU|nr:HAD-IIB family hydrolase [Spiroplasma litorale]AKX33783.1 HAD superfamily hydrolase [Spiroplasma litorale]
MEIKLKKNIVIFSDLDGTALLDNHEFSDRLKNLINRLYEKNIYFVPVTARITKDAVNQQAIYLGLDKHKGIVVANNGSQVYDFSKNKFIIDKHISKELLKKIFDMTYGKIGEYKVHYFAGDTCYVYGFGENSNYWAKVMNVDYKIINKFEDIEKNVSHMTFILNEEYAEKNKEKFLEEFDFLLDQIDIIKYTNRVYELASKNVNKGSIVIEILNYLGLDKNETTTFAFGDGYNDIPLLKSVDYPIALENSIDELKEIAFAITKSNNEDGVAHFIEKEILKEK